MVQPLWRVCTKVLRDVGGSEHCHRLFQQRVSVPTMDMAKRLFHNAVLELHFMAILNDFPKQAGVPPEQSQPAVRR